MSPAISSKSGHGGARANAGGARTNSGGARSGAGRKRAAPVAVHRVADIPRWYCVRTEYQADLTADIELREAGFEVFAPTEWKPATRARRNANGSVRAAKADRIEALFPRYIFVRFNRGEDQWRRIKDLDGVDYLFSSAPELPVAVPEHAISLIRAVCELNDCKYPPGKNLRELHADIRLAAMQLAAGTDARLLDGPLANLTGICALSGRRRAKLMIEIMGRLVAVDVSQAAVEAV